ncbi:MAG TPA: recombinase family protein [Spirillospora sp.]|nr:recombinase family protein [Spirillospora sp.]
MPRLRPVDEQVAAVQYVRVSMVGTREEIISPELQLATTGQLADARAWPVVERIEELDATGRSFARAGVRRAIEGVEAGDWQIVLVHRYDRFGRNTRDSLVNIARVEAAGGEVVSATEPFDAKTAIGKYGRTNILAVAELQSDLIGEGWKAVHARRLDHGLPHSGGYRLGYTQPDRHSYVPDPTWAPIVVELYRRYVAGAGGKQLARWLTALRAPSRYKGHHRWSDSGVRGFLATGFAAGLLHHSDGSYAEGAHEPILPPGLWDAYLAAKAARATAPPRLRTAVTPLSGLVYCAHCDHRMRAGSTAKDGPGGTFQCVHLHCPRRPGRLTRYLEAEVLAWLADYDREVTVRAQARSAAVEYRAAARVEQRALAREVARIDRALVRLVTERAELPEGVYRTARDELLADREAAAAELDRAGGEAKVAAPRKVEVHGLLADWPRLRTDPPAANRVLAALLWVQVGRDAQNAAVTRVVPRWMEPPPAPR